MQNLPVFVVSAGRHCPDLADEKSCGCFIVLAPVSVHQAEHNWNRVFCVSSYFLLMAYFLVGDSSALIMNKLKCPHCNYVAKYRRTLKRHLLIHTGVRSFSCDICGKLFTRREHVKRHSLVGNLVCVYVYVCTCTSGFFSDVLVVGRNTVLWFATV